MLDVNAVSQQLINAYKTGQAITPLREIVQTIDEAYAVQKATNAWWQRQGRTLRGHKIGLTSLAVQQQLGVDQPDFGVLFADMVFPHDSQLAHSLVMQPRVEAEVAFVLKRDLRGKEISPQEVIEATDFISPALEICGSRIEGWNIKIADTIADNASSGVVVLGAERHQPKLEELPGLSVTLKHGDLVASEGTGAACLGNPAIAVAWLAETLTSHGNGLRAGDLVMSGAMSKMLAAAPGDRFEANFGTFGHVAVQFI